MTADDAPRAGRKEWIGLAVLALPCLLYSMDLTVLNLAVPALGGGVAAGHQLPAPFGAELLDAAREAFTNGMHVTAVASAAVMAGTAILAAVLLRQVPAGASSEGQPDLEPDGSVAGSADGRLCSAAAVPTENR